jgi:phage recombination protein Bet
MAIANQLSSSNVTSLQIIDQTTLTVLKETLYPGAKDESIAMVLNYCKARKLDPIKKPVHLVPMNVKTGRKGQDGKDIYEWRDVVMPGIGLYRIEADRSGQYAGMSEPEFGEDITEKVGNTMMTYPRWCKITVKKLLNDQIVEFTAKEYWKENYATKKRDDMSPNAMWEKRAYGQLAKCTEAQALRKAFPDVVGQDYTKEEMEGKHFPDSIKVVKQENIELHEIEKDVLDISWAESVEHLQEVYTKAYKYWSVTKNKENLKRLMEAKDTKKDEFKITVPQEEINVETGEIK